MTAAPKPLTPKQAAVLRFVVGFVAARGFAPTVEAIRTHFGWASKNGVATHLEALRRKGRLLDPDPNAARTVRVAGLDDLIRAAARDFLKGLDDGRDGD